ncbi:hypothetical protein F66182_8995, partial [Fusarium sp. NRRL 66182]
MHIKYLLFNLLAVTASVKAISAADNELDLEARDEANFLDERDGYKLNCGHDAKEVYGKCVCKKSDYEWNGKKCVCPKGKKEVYGKCVDDKPKCPYGQYYKDGKCQCPHDKEWKYGKCIPKCPKGQDYNKHSGKCECPKGTEW